jgi:hypothetical protein
MGLFGIFRRSSQVPALPQPVTHAAGDLREAHHGVTFRTVHLKPQEDILGKQGEWLQACLEQGGKNRWRVLKCRPLKRESSFALTEEPFESRVYRDGLGFFDALALLAEYEVGQQRLGWEAAEDKADLGLRHYEAFGKRERVKFDVAGQPVPEEAPLAALQLPPVRNIFTAPLNAVDWLPEGDAALFRKLLEDHKTRAYGKLRPGTGANLRFGK